MPTAPDSTPRALRIDAPLSARAVLDHFNEKGRALLGVDQQDAAVRIAQGMLERGEEGCVVAIACDRGDRYFPPAKWDKRYAW